MKTKTKWWWTAALPAGTTVELKPGGYHLMFITPGDGFVAGNRVQATLVFAGAGEITVEFQVRQGAATSGPFPPPGKC